MITCPCGGRLQTKNSGRRWMKESAHWKYTLICKDCEAPMVVYTDASGLVVEVGARPAGRPHKVEIRFAV